MILRLFFILHGSHSAAMTCFRRAWDDFEFWLEALSCLTELSLSYRCAPLSCMSTQQSTVILLHIFSLLDPIHAVYLNWMEHQFHPLDKLHDPPPPHRHHHPISARHVEYKCEEVIIGAHLINQYAGIHTTKSTKILVFIQLFYPSGLKCFLKINIIQSFYINRT